MRILVNTASSFKGGGIQTSKSFIEECVNHSDNEYFIVLSQNLSKALKFKKFPNNFEFYKAPFRPATKVLRLKSHNYFLKEIEKVFKPDIVFTVGGPSYWRPRAIHLMGFTLGHYVYSESPYFRNIPLKRKLWWKLMKIYAQYVFKRDADALVVQTDDVNTRVKKFLGKSKVFTVYNTINTHYVDVKPTFNKLPDKNHNEYRLLTLSAWYPHKNLEIIPEVIRVLNEKGYDEIKFVITISETDFKKLRDGGKNLINLGPIKIEEAPSLYKECDAMFLPTLLECFSASYVEAMKMEKPIITSDLGFAHTICEEAAIYFDPMDPVDIANKIIELVKSKNIQKTLVEKGLKKLEKFGTAEQRANRYLEICKSFIDENKR